MILTMAIRCRSGVLRQLTLCALGLALAGGCARDSPTDAAALRRALGKEIDRYVQSDRAAPPAHCQVLFVGSSSIVVWKRSLAADMAPLPVIDRGFGSSYIEHVISGSMRSWRPTIRAPSSSTPVRTTSTPASQWTRWWRTSTPSWRASPRCWATPPCTSISLKPSKARFKQMPQQSAVNAAIRARAGTRPDLHFIDVVPLMLESGQPKNIFGPDGLHMTPAGYVLWTAAVKAALLPNNDAQLKGCEQKEARP